MKTLNEHVEIMREKVKKYQLDEVDLATEIHLLIDMDKIRDINQYADMDTDSLVDHIMKQVTK